MIKISAYIFQEEGKLIKKLKKQHENILFLFKNLNSFIEGKAISKTNCMLTLLNLRNELVKHLTLEDKELYPTEYILDAENGVITIKEARLEDFGAFINYTYQGDRITSTEDIIEPVVDLDSVSVAIENAGDESGEFYVEGKGCSTPGYRHPTITSRASIYALGDQPRADRINLIQGAESTVELPLTVYGSARPVGKCGIDVMKYIDLNNQEKVYTYEFEICSDEADGTTQEVLTTTPPICYLGTYHSANSDYHLGDITVEAMNTVNEQKDLELFVSCGYPYVTDMTFVNKYNPGELKTVLIPVYIAGEDRPAAECEITFKDDETGDLLAEKQTITLCEEGIVTDVPPQIIGVADSYCKKEEAHISYTISNPGINEKVVGMSLVCPVGTYADFSTPQTFTIKAGEKITSDSVIYAYTQDKPSVQCTLYLEYQGQPTDEDIIATANLCSSSPERCSFGATFCIGDQKCVCDNNQDEYTCSDCSKGDCAINTDGEAYCEAEQQGISYTKAAGKFNKPSKTEKSTTLQLFRDGEQCGKGPLF